MNLARWAVAAALLASLALRPAAAEPPTPAEVLALTVDNAVLFALEHNQALAVERLHPAIARTGEQRERAVFDPVLTGDVSRVEGQGLRQSPSGTNTLQTTIGQTAAGVALTAQLPAGTRVAVGGSSVVANPPIAGGAPLAAARLGVTVSQSLLQGLGTGVNLANLRQARLDTRISVYELRGLAEALASSVEQTCWDYLLANRQLEIVRASLQLAEQQLAEVRERIAIGKLAAVERAAAEAEVALRREALIDAESLQATTRLHLLRLLNPPGADLWTRTLTLQAQPDLSCAAPDPVEDHVAVALYFRPDLNQARLLVQRHELEVVKTKNGLLPKLDFFITLGRTGYAETFPDALRGKEDQGYDVAVGLAGAFPLANRAARAGLTRATLSRDQALLAMTNLSQLVQEDVRAAHVRLRRARAQVDATQATRRAEEEKSRAEVEKFRVGKSTSLLVAQAQRDLLQSRLHEAQADAGCCKALAELYRLDGSLLARRGLVIAETEPKD
ncbi:MAG: TolC family protein [Kiritimatiellaeota bacterium]|nr:TolC family protein [Kiritimatiellota bacterium]